mgnify:CR=1 FL=1
MKKYCRLCKKKEERNQCGYGPKMWDKYSVNDANDDEIKKAAEDSGITSGDGGEGGMGESHVSNFSDAVLEGNKSGDNSLRDWFGKSRSSDGKPGWVQLGGKYAGKPCARQPGQTTKPKCGSSKMKRNLSKDEEERVFRRKNRKDPNPDRKGKAINVKTEEVVLEKKGEKDACYKKVKSRYSVWPSAYASGALVKCRKVGAANWGNSTKKESVEYIDEISKKTLGSYVQKASTEIGTSAIKGDYKKMQKRHKGVLDASDKMAKEEVIPEAKVDKGRSDYGKASIRNYRRMGPGHGEPGMFDPEGKRGKTIDKRREEHKARRGVKGAKVPAYKVEEVEVDEAVSQAMRPSNMKKKAKLSAALKRLEDLKVASKMKEEVEDTE